MIITGYHMFRCRCLEISVDAQPEWLNDCVGLEHVSVAITFTLLPILSICFCFK